MDQLQAGRPATPTGKLIFHALARLRLIPASAGRPAIIPQPARPSSRRVAGKTVSRALNDKPEIDATTKARVLDAARELGFRPSRFARALVRQDTTSVGLVIPDLMNPFFTEVASAALEAARRRGWHVVVYDTADDREQELGTLEVIGSQVDAIVGYLSAPADVVARYTGGIPVVYIGRGERRRELRFDPGGR